MKKYVNVKIEKLMETIKMFKTMKGDMAPIRVEVGNDYFKKAMGDKYDKRKIGVPVVFNTNDYATIVIAEESEPAARKNSKK